MQKSIIATTILLLISIALISLTFGIGERLTIINYGENSAYADGNSKTRRIDMSAPDALTLTPTKSISGFDLAVDLEDMYLSDGVNAQSEIEYINHNMLLTDEEFESGMPNPKILPAMVLAANTTDEAANKISDTIRAALENAKSSKAPRVSAELSKISVFRYEPVLIEASIYTEETVKDINMYVRYKRDERVRKNGDDRYPINVFKIANSKYKGTYLHPFGGELGEYQAVILIQTKSGIYAYTTDFTVKGVQSPPSKGTKRVTTLEYSVDISSKKVPRVDTGELTSYDAMYDWVRYMKCDTFWVLGGQTTGWNGFVKQNSPWVPDTIKNVELLASSKSKGDVKLGAYIMSYFAPGGGAAKGGYEPSIGYNSTTKSLVESRHISLNSQKRLNDIIALMKRYEANPNVSYLGLDFIRTGEVDGYEMVDEMVELTGVYTPANWSTMNIQARMKWLAVNRGRKEIGMKWRWFRAHKEALIIKAIKDSGITKTFWVFTLGWNHGQEHGQDPYMFFDAGIDYDAVMIYEANRAQQLGMLVSWPQYLGGEYNVLVGNMIDNRLQDGSLRPELEYMRRLYETEAKFNRSSRIRGVFFHDVSRMLWSRFRGSGNSIRDWANINASVVSRIEEKYSENPFNVSVELNEQNRTGVLTIVNRTSKRQSNVNIKVDLSQALSSIVLDEDTVTLEPGESMRIGFKYAYGKNRYSSLMSFRVKSDVGEENVAVVYTLLNTLKMESPKPAAPVVVKADADKEKTEEEISAN